MDNGGSVAGRIARGDVRLCRFASPDKLRPVVVLTRDTAIEYLAYVSVAPITSTIRGAPSEVALGPEDGMKAPCAVSLHNTVTVKKEMLGKRLAQLHSSRMREVCSALGFAIGCDSH